MSVNHGNKFYLKSIVRSNDRTRRGKQRRATVSDIILTVNNPPDEEENKEKTAKVVENEPQKQQKQQNHFFPGAVALNSVILIFFLLYLEQKQKIVFNKKLFLNHPEEQKEFTTMFNTIHYFILILFFIGFSPIHILYFTNNNKNAKYERTKNSFIIVLFSVLYAIIQEQNSILYLLLFFLTNSVILGLGILMEFNEIIHRKYFFMVLFLTFFIQSLPTITSGYKTTELPVVFYLLTFFWFLFGVIEILLHYKHTMSYFHIIIQIIFSWGIFFIIFESPKMI